jgi:inorganic pyrophosphatase
MSLLSTPIGRDAPAEVHAIIEIPMGSSNKYEYDLKLEAFVLDRVLYSPLYYPCDYGWVAGTLSEDGDPLDILVIGSHPTFSGCVVHARPLGSLMMRDEEGTDYKILAVSSRDPRYAQTHVLDDLPEHSLKEIVHFFTVYKELEQKESEVLGWQDRETAYGIIRECHSRYRGRDPRSDGAGATVLNHPDTKDTQKDG